MQSFKVSNSAVKCFYAKKNTQKKPKQYCHRNRGAETEMDEIKWNINLFSLIT